MWSIKGVYEGRMTFNEDIAPGTKITYLDTEMEDDQALSEATFRHTVYKIRNLNIVCSPSFHVRNLPWKIVVKSNKNTKNQKCLGYYLCCVGERSTLSCYVEAELRLISHKPDTEPFSKTVQRKFDSERSNWGFPYFIPWDDLLDLKKGYLKDDSITLEVYMSATENGKEPCLNKSKGCMYTMVHEDVQDHLEECSFRESECPLGLVFGKCSWQGNVKEIMDHFKQRHTDYCDFSSDADIVLEDIDIEEDERYFFLVSQDKMLFILTFRLDTHQEMAYWTVQYIGSKVVAKQYIYEIHVINNQDRIRKLVFTELCFNDGMKTDEMFRLRKCAVFPLKYLSHFIKDDRLTFKFFIKKLSETESPKQEEES